MRKYIVLGLSVGAGAAVALALVLCGVWRYTEFSSATEWPTLKEPSGITVGLKTKMADGQVLYQLTVAPAHGFHLYGPVPVGGDIKNTGAIVPITLYDGDGFSVCRIDAYVKFDTVTPDISAGLVPKPSSMGNQVGSPEQPEIDLSAGLEPRPPGATDPFARFGGKLAEAEPAAKPIPPGAVIELPIFDGGDQKVNENGAVTLEGHVEDCMWGHYRRAARWGVETADHFDQAR